MTPQMTCLYNMLQLCQGQMVLIIIQGCSAVYMKLNEYVCLLYFHL